MTIPLVTLVPLVVVLAVMFLVARPLALIAGVAGALLAAFRLINALRERDWPLLLRDALLTALCALIFWALLILV